MEIAFLGTHRNLLGESPLWDGQRCVLWWVDSVAQLICRAAPDGGAFQSWEAPAMVGSIGLASQGWLIAALRDGFYAFDPAHGTFTALATPAADEPGVRFNDGKADRQGRFLSGTMRHGGGDGAPGKLFRLEPGGATAVLESGIKVSNAICFSPDGATLYFADSLEQCIWAYDYGDAAHNRRVAIDTRPLGSVPDGATVDADGNIWVALVLTQQVACFTPAGALIRCIDLPVPLPSCPAFGGDGLSTLFVTTISDSKASLVSDHPEAGRMLAITGLGVTGIAEPVSTLTLPEQP